MTSCRQIRRNMRREEAVKVNIISRIASPEKTWTESNGCGGVLVSLYVVSTNSNNSSPDSCGAETLTPRWARFITPSPDGAVWLNTELQLENRVDSYAKFMSEHEAHVRLFQTFSHHQSGEITLSFSLFQKSSRPNRQIIDYYIPPFFLMYCSLEHHQIETSQLVSSI